MMSLNMGTINLWTPSYENVFMNEIPRIKKWVGYMYEAGIKPELEFYDTGMINATKMLVRDGVMKEPLHVGSSWWGQRGGHQRPRHNVRSRAVESELDLSVCSLGRTQLPMGAFAADLGGHVRVASRTTYTSVTGNSRRAMQTSSRG
jgi:3-keto-5-aminohexanoate cleavage enzyme